MSRVKALYLVFDRTKLLRFRKVQSCVLRKVQLFVIPKGSDRRSLLVTVGEPFSWTSSWGVSIYDCNPNEVQAFLRVGNWWMEFAFHLKEALSSKFRRERSCNICEAFNFCSSVIVITVSCFLEARLNSVPFRGCDTFYTKWRLIWDVTKVSHSEGRVLWKFSIVIGQWHCRSNPFLLKVIFSAELGREDEVAPAISTGWRLLPRMAKWQSVIEAFHHLIGTDVRVQEIEILQHNRRLSLSNCSVYRSMVNLLASGGECFVQGFWQSVDATSIVHKLETYLRMVKLRIAADYHSLEWVTVVNYYHNLWQRLCNYNLLVMVISVVFAILSIQWLTSTGILTMSMARRMDF